MPIVFKKSLPAESETLSEIAILAKGHWGYPQHLLDLWRNTLQVKPDYIEANTLRSIWLDQEIVGFFSIVEKPTPTLDHLWLHPRVIGQGIGKAALAEITRLARQLHLPELIIISDPNAEPFYLHHGAIRIGETPSIPQNRMLPKLLLKIAN